MTFLLTQQADVVLLQEVWDPGPATLAALLRAGFDCFVRRRDGRRGGGTAILVKRSVFASEELVLPQVEPLEACAVRLRGVDGSTWNVASVYIPPDIDCDLPALLAQLSALPIDIMGGDLNARSPAWCPATTLDTRSCAVTRGASLEDWLLRPGGWTVNSDVSPPMATTTYGTALDLFLFGPRVETTPAVALPSLVSDHHFLVLLAPMADAAVKRRRARAILWQRVTPRQLEEAARLLPSQDSAVSAALLEESLQQIAARLPSSSWLRPDVCRAPLHDEPFLQAAGAKVRTDAAAWHMLTGEFRLPPPNMPLHDPSGRVLVSARQRARGFLSLFQQKHVTATATHRSPPSNSIAAPRAPLTNYRAVTRWEVRSALDRLNKSGCCDDAGVAPRLILALRYALEPLLAVAFSRQLTGDDPIPAGWRDCTWVPLKKN